MAFGQQSGPPASGRQMRELAELLEQAGYATFREARGPLGFTQRQGGGKFTSDEATALIEQLENQGSDTVEERPPPPTPPPKRSTRPVAKASAPPSAIAIERREGRQAAMVKDLPAHILARDLERRGWILIPPDDFVPPDPPPSS